MKKADMDLTNESQFQIWAEELSLRVNKYSLNDPREHSGRNEQAALCIHRGEMALIGLFCPGD